MTTNAYSITAADVVYNWTLMTQDEEKSSVGFGLLLTNQSNIHLFRTRKGCLGILEVLKAPQHTGCPNPLQAGANGRRQRPRAQALSR